MQVNSLPCVHLVTVRVEHPQAKSALRDHGRDRKVDSVFPFLVVSFLSAEYASVPAVVAVSTREYLESPRHIDRVDDVRSCCDPLTLSVNVESKVVELKALFKLSGRPVRSGETII
jgi:hypothetical protein